MPDELNIPNPPSLTGHDDLSDEELDGLIGGEEPEETTEEAPEETPEEVSEEQPEATDEPEEKAEESEEGEPEKTDEERIASIREKYGDDSGKIAEAYLRQQRFGWDKHKKLEATEQEKDALAQQVEELKQIAVGLRPEETKKETKEAQEKAENILEMLNSYDPEQQNRALAILKQQAKEEAVSEIDKRFQEREQESLIKEANEYNNSLADDRARELLLDVATKLGDKEGIQKYSDANYRPTIEEQKPVLDKLNKEIAWIQENAKIHPDTFKYKTNVFRLAQLDMYGADQIKAAEKNGAQRVIDQLQKEDPVAGIAPKGGAKVEKRIDASKAKDYYSAKKVADQMSDEELEEAARLSDPYSKS